MIEINISSRDISTQIDQAIDSGEIIVLKLANGETATIRKIEKEVTKEEDDFFKLYSEKLRRIGI